MKSSCTVFYQGLEVKLTVNFYNASAILLFVRVLLKCLY